MSQSRTRQLLADLLLGSDSRARGSANHFDDLSFWDEAVTTAAEWKVIPQLISQLDRLKHSVPPASALRLKRQAIATGGPLRTFGGKGSGGYRSP